MESPAEIYRERIHQLEAKKKKLDSLDNQWVTIRLISFISFVAAIIYLGTIQYLFAIISTYLGIFAFYQIVKKHQGIKRDKRITSHLLDLNHAELRALDNDLSFFRSGKSYMDDAHRYSSDLDIFGDHSIFQLLNRTTSYEGDLVLAQTLKYGLPSDQLAKSRKIVGQLEPEILWRQMLYALGKIDFDYDNNFMNLRSWIESPRSFYRPGWQFLLLALFSLSLFVALLLWLPWHLALIAFIPNAIVTLRTKKSIDKIHFALEKNEDLLHSMQDVLSFLEKTSLPDPISSQLELIRKESVPASKSIAKFAYAIRQLNVRYNVFGILLHLISLWDIYWIYRLENWKKKNRFHFVEWIDLIAYLESMSSLANFGFNYTESTFPKTDGDELKAKDLGHPLIGRGERVTNDFNMRTHRCVTLVTGSNMAGKSTFLRTVGVNLVLASAGCKVLAKEFTSPRIYLFTSMRTQDALKENTSSFYAELKRIKRVLEAAEKENDVFFLMDEILKGTNSRDRHAGAKAIILQLLEQEAAGIISTHDLGLGKWVEESELPVQNICFEVEVAGNELQFDYKIKRGISKSFNATELMRNMGVRI